MSQASEFHPIYNLLQNGASNISILKSHSVLSCVAPDLSQWNSIPQKSYPGKQKTVFFDMCFFLDFRNNPSHSCFFWEGPAPAPFSFSIPKLLLWIYAFIPDHDRVDCAHQYDMHTQCYLCVCLWPIAPRAKLSQNWSWPSNMFFLFCLVILLPWSWFNWVWLSWFWCVLKPKIPMDKIIRAGPGINFQFKHQHVPTSLGWNSCTDLQDTYGLNFGPESGTPKKRLKVGLEPKSFSQGPQRGIINLRWFSEISR